jgi:uncharacterized damage-inducible protein DinB
MKFGVLSAGLLPAKEVLLTDVLYSAWANQRVLETCSTLPAAELEQDLKISHTSILGTFRHIHDGERVWLDCLRSSPEVGPWVLPQDEPPEPSFDELRQNWPELWEGYQRLLEDLSDDDLGVELVIRLPNGIEPRLPRWKILRHVLNHSTLHRGQLIGMIRILGHQPPQTDVLTYYGAARASRLAVQPLSP